MSEKNKVAGKTQNEVIKGLAEKTGLTVVKVKEVVDTPASMATEELKSAGVFVLPGIGKLRAKESAERQGRNPRTGAAVTIPKSRRVGLTMAKAFKNEMK